jgi:predicted LPLAT superfamily acyltransferase
MSGSSAAPAAEASDARRWSRIAERGSLLGMRLTVWCYRRLGRTVGVALVHGIVAYFYTTDRVGRRASRDYLRRVAATAEGRRHFGRQPGLWASFLHYRSFGLSILDRLAIWAGRTDDFAFDVRGEDICDRLAEQRRGAVILGAHLGSFDALRLLAERQQRSVHVLMYREHAQRINAIFRELSPDVELRVIEIDPNSVRSAFQIRDCVARGELVCILADRVEPGGRERTSRVCFLGGEVELPRAPFLLASLLACPVLLMLASQTGPGRYDVFTEELSDGRPCPPGEREKHVTELLTAYAGRLEYYCSKYPCQWFNFYDYWPKTPASPSGA